MLEGQGDEEIYESDLSEADVLAEADQLLEGAGGAVDPPDAWRDLTMDEVLAEVDQL